MMRTLATVVAVDNGHITVSCKQETSCGHCASRDSCGTGIVSKAMPGRSHQINIATTETITLGQVVEIGLSERSMLSSALLVYMLPLLFLIGGSVIGQYVFIDLAGSNQLGVIVSAAVSTAVGLMIARHYAKRLDGDAAYKPSLIRVLGLPISADKLINAASKDSE